MKKLSVVFCYIIFVSYAFAYDDSNKLQWLYPDDADWIVVDSLPCLEGKEGYIPYYKNINCCDSLNCIAFAQDIINSDFFIVRHSTDGGLNWSTILVDSIGVLGKYSFAYPKKDLALIGCDSGYIMKSTDGGYSWKRKRLPEETWKNQVNVINMHDNIGVANCQNGELYITEDGGENWRKLTTESNIQNQHILFASMPDSDAIFITISNLLDSTYNYYSSFDRGKTWKSLSNSKFNNINGFSQMTFINRKIGWAAKGIQKELNSPQYRTYVWNTIDGGFTWNLKFSDTVPTYMSAGVPILGNKSNILIRKLMNLYLSKDGGETWSTYKTTYNGKQNATISNTAAFFPVPEHPLVVSRSRILRYDKKIIAVKEQSVDKSFHIFPNPTGERMSIQHGLQSGIVAIYNLLGEKTYEGKIEEENPLNIDVSDWRCGVYLCVVRGGSGIITEKVVIARE
ncbi:MAG: Por secretion system C-terminal sorting protein [Ignavibacteria bacterium]|nr:Por secretion system C-terminal sorting protein [Ignavibacteria bacterium]